MKKMTAFLLLLAMLALCGCSNVADGPDSVGGVTGETGSNTAELTTEPTTTEATEPSTTEATTPSFCPDRLSVWGLPEPSFAYEFLGYCEVMKGPDMVPRFYYSGSADYAIVRAYAELLSDAGWNDYVDDPGETSVFAFGGTLGDYRMLIRREVDGGVIIYVTDRSVLAVWDDELDTYVVPEYGEYGSYGENDSTLLDL